MTPPIPQCSGELEQEKDNLCDNGNILNLIETLYE